MIAVTGGLGTGKSTVSKVLALALDAELLDMDRLCRHQLEPGAEGYEKVRDAFGQQLILADGRLDRNLLRQQVFEDNAARKDLENILHPIVALDLRRYRKICTVRNQQLVVEVPLLFEVGWQHMFDTTVVVYVPPAICLERVLQRDCLSKALIYKIMSSQIEIGLKCSLADYCIDNSGTFVSTLHQISWLAGRLKGLKNSKQYY